MKETSPEQLILAFWLVTPYTCSYAYRAAKIMEAPEVRREERKHWLNLNQLIEEAHSDVDD